MGILNVTPDSFWDGGRHFKLKKAIGHGLRMVREGADIIDVGGESTRPGSLPISTEEELKRVIPVIEAISSNTDAIISIDTTKSEVAFSAIEAGASIVNDVSALCSDHGMVRVVRDCDAAVVLMHMRGTPRTMQNNPRYRDVVTEVTNFLDKRASYARKSGIKKHSIVIDPGIGFGKTLKHNLALLKGLNKIRDLGYPVLVGPSRKSFIGQITGFPTSKRLEGTLAAATVCAMNGADIVRVHDVNEVKKALAVADAVGRENAGYRRYMSSLDVCD